MVQLFETHVKQVFEEEDLRKVAHGRYRYFSLHQSFILSMHEEQAPTSLSRFQSEFHS